MQVPGRFALGRVDPHVEQHYLAPVLIFLAGIGVALLFVSAGSVLVWSAITLIGVGLGASTLYKAILFVDLYGIERIGLLNVVLTPRRDHGAIAPFATTLLVAHAHGYTAAFIILAGLSVTGAVIARHAFTTHTRTVHSVFINSTIIE